MTDHHDRVREHRDDALAGAGDGARRAHAARRADRSTRSRPTTSSSPTPGELSGTLFLELTSDAQLREWLPEARRHRARASRSRSPTGASRAGEPSDEDEQRLTRDRHDRGRALPAVRVHARAGRRVRRRVRCELRRRPPRVPARGRARRDEQRRGDLHDLTCDSRTLTYGRRTGVARSLRGCASRSAGSIPVCRSRPRSTTATPGIDLYAAVDAHARARGRARARARPASRSRSPRATPGSCSPAPGSRCGTA